MWERLELADRGRPFPCTLESATHSVRLGAAVVGFRCVRVIAFLPRAHFGISDSSTTCHACMHACELPEYRVAGRRHRYIVCSEQLAAGIRSQSMYLTVDSRAPGAQRKISRKERKEKERKACAPNGHPVKVRACAREPRFGFIFLPAGQAPNSKHKLADSLSVSAY